MKTSSLQERSARKMPISRTQPYSRYTTEAATVFAQLIRSERIEKKISLLELSQRAGISNSLLVRIEKGDLKCSLGAYFEVANILGLELFEASEMNALATRKQNTQAKLKLLPKAARKPKLKVRNDF
jgi:ribosome-binding protein aMBF1 (putative translation factor)